jgi:hypothetical protein
LEKDLVAFAAAEPDGQVGVCGARPARRYDLGGRPGRGLRPLLPKNPASSKKKRHDIFF